MTTVFVATLSVVFMATFSVFVNGRYQCPAPTHWVGGICVEECNYDGDCRWGHSCCSTGCGHVCVKPVCEEPRCEIYCEHGWQTGYDGCPTCTCATRDVCAGVQCDLGQSCRAVSVKCPTHSCDPAPICQMCRELDCPHCPHGSIQRRDVNGCHTCQCYDPCEGHQCAPGERCVLSRQNCQGEDICDPSGFCEPSPAKCPAIQTLIDTCREQCTSDQKCLGQRMKCCPTSTCGNQCLAPVCPPVKCMPCPHGSVYKLDHFGCNTCECYNPCYRKGHYCPPNNYCVSEEVQCVTWPCYPIPTCKLCPYLACPACKTGMIPKKDMYGCPTCQCLDPCATVKCGYNQECEVMYLPCNTEPCYPQAKCKDKRRNTHGFSSSPSLYISYCLLPIAFILNKFI